MISKKKALNIVIVAAALLIGICGYFLVPKYFGDEVYPLQYADSIQKYSNQFGVDPALVAAVILQESRFNPKARSSKGAQGLMQFMPTTAATMAKELGVKNYDIFNAETSIMFGAAHIRDLLIKYNGNVDAALAGYNAGTGNADKWIRLGLMGNIPFNETRNYVKKVKNYRTVYATMYAKELGLADPTIEFKGEPKEAGTAKVQGFIWSRIFSNVFNFGR